MNSHTEKAEKQSGELFRCTGRSGGQQVLPCAEKQDMSKTEAMLHYEQTDHNCELVPRVVVERYVPMSHPRPGQRVQCSKCYAMIDADKAWADTTKAALYHSGCRSNNFDVREVKE